MISAIDNCKDGSALGVAERYDLECGTMGDFEGGWLAFHDRWGADGWPFEVVLIVRACPANRVSGEAVLRGLKERVGTGRSSGRVGVADGDGFDSLRTSFKEVFVPFEANCHGDDDLTSASVLAIWYWAAACCCCFLRSFCESFWGGVVAPAASLVFWAERLIDKFDVRVADACAIISFMPNFVGVRIGDDHVFVTGVGGGVPTFWRLEPADFGRLGESAWFWLVSESPTQTAGIHAKDVLAGLISSEVAIGFGDVGSFDVNVSSSSMSNIKSTVESFGRMVGLKGAFRDVLDFRLALSWLGELDITSSKLPMRAR
jgi:hypothetical protein